MPEKPLKLTKKNLKLWKTRLQDAVNEQKNYKPEQEALINLWQGKFPVQTPELWVDVPKYFPLAELKKHQLFFKTPKIQLLPNMLLKEKFPDMAFPMATALETVVNKMLAPTEMNVKAEVHKALFDVIIPGGMGAVKIGFRANVVPTTFKAGETNPGEPTIQVPAVDELGIPTGQVEEQPNLLVEDVTLDVPVYEEYFFEQFSLSKLLSPRDFKDTMYDKSPWLGMQFEMSIPQAINLFGLPKDYKPTGSPEDLSFDVNPGGRRPSDEIVRGIEIWYQTSYYDSKVNNPELFRKLVFINGQEDPVEHKDHPHQTLGPDGKLTPDSQRGNPLHVLVIRDMSDSSRVPSDAAIIRPLVRELTKGRSQMLNHRDRSIPMNWHDRNRVSPTDIAKWEKGLIGASIPVDGNGNEVFGEIPRASMRSENFQFNQVIDQDIREAFSMGSNQQGVETSEKKSATELSIVDQNSKIGIDGQRDRVMEWFLLGIEKKFFPLLMRYGLTDPAFTSKFVGDQGTQLIQQWLSAGISPSLSFDIMPDSGNHYDSQVRLEQLFKAYEFMAKDPNYNRVPTMRKILSLMDVDPAESVVEELPEKKPDPPNISLRFGDESINPVMPAFPVFKEIVEQLGLKITEQAITKGLGQFEVIKAAVEMLGQVEAAQAGEDGEHKGLNPKAEILSKRESTEGQQDAGMQGLPEGVQ